MGRGRLKHPSLRLKTTKKHQVFYNLNVIIKMRVKLAMVEFMVKVIKIHDENYSKLLNILHDLEKEKNERVSFDEVISLLIAFYIEKRKVLKETK
jgi:predicted CopG family antitoxin